MSIISDVTSGEVQLLDVRDDSEWETERAVGATHIVLGALLEGDTGSLNKKKPIYVFCESGERASMAEFSLNENGFTALNIGGLQDWKAAGGSIERV